MTSQDSELSPAPARRRAILVTTVGGLLASLIAAWFVTALVRERMEPALRHAADGVAAVLANHLTLIEGQLHALSGLYALDRAISPAEFTTFAEAIRPGREVMALHSVRLVPAAERDRFEASQSARYGRPVRLEIAPGETADGVHYAIEDFYRPDGLALGPGIDLGRVPASRDALRRLALDAPIASSGSFESLWRPGAPVFAIYRAVPADNRVAGALAAVIDISRLMTLAATPQASVRSLVEASGGASVFAIDDPPPRGRVMTRDLTVGDLRWTLAVDTQPQRSALSAGLATFGVGALLTLLAIAGLEQSRLEARNRAFGRELGRSQQSLEVREAAYQALFHNAATANLEIDAGCGTIRLANGRAAHLTGQPAEALAGQPFEAIVHPADRPAAAATLAHWLTGTGEQSPFELRLTHPEGEPVWVLASGGRPYAAPGGGRLVCVAMQDITAMKAAERARDLLTRELAHRLRNTMQLVSSLAEQTARSSTSAADYRDRLQGRLRALNMAQDALFDTEWGPVRLDTLARRILAPFHAETDPAIRLSADPVTLAAQPAQTIALALHELASNATRHGALRHPGGRVEVSLTLAPADAADGNPTLELDWQEHGARRVRPVPSRRGFGLIVLEQLLARQHGGTSRLVWTPTGLRFEASLPLDGTPS